MMWYTLHLLLCDFVCDHVQPSVNLHRVGVQDLGLPELVLTRALPGLVQRKGEVNPELRFAYPSRADHRHQRLL